MFARSIIASEALVSLPCGLRLSFEDRPTWAEREFIDNALGDYNAPFLQDPGYSYFGIFVRDDNRAIHAGLIGNCYAGWLFTNLLWIHADLRRQGIGRRLIGEAERHARAFGCHSAHVDTFSFQAPDFYRKLRLRGLRHPRLSTRSPALLSEEALAAGNSHERVSRPSAGDHGAAARSGARLPVGPRAGFRDDRALYDRGSL